MPASTRRDQAFDRSCGNALPARIDGRRTVRGPLGNRTRGRRPRHAAAGLYRRGPGFRRRHGAERRAEIFLQCRLWAQDQLVARRSSRHLLVQPIQFRQFERRPPRQPHRRGPGRLLRRPGFARRHADGDLLHLVGARRQAGHGRQVLGRRRDVVHRRPPVPAADHRRDQVRSPPQGGRRSFAAADCR